MDLDEALLFLASGAFMIVWGGFRLTKVSGSKGWPVVEGEITSCEISEGMELGLRSWTIVYTYSAYGIPHSGSETREAGKRSAQEFASITSAENWELSSNGLVKAIDVMRWQQRSRERMAEAAD